jgi:hypothetical protein
MKKLNVILMIFSKSTKFHLFIKIFRILLLGSLIILIQCNKPKDPPAPPQSGNIWIQDLDYLSQKLQSRHKNLFHNVSSNDFYSAVDSLRVQIPSLEDYEIIVGMMKIVTLIGDAHTNLTPDLQSEIFQLFPIEMYWYNDGLYVISTTSENQNILGQRVVGIGNFNIDDVNNILKSVIPHENDAQIKSKVPLYMTSPEILFALNITNSRNSALFKFEGIGEVSIDAENIFSNFNWVSVFDDAPCTTPLYLQNPQLNYWFTLIEDSTVIYAQYNRCYEMESQSFNSFANEIFDYIDSYPIDKFIFDMRLNGGGRSSIARPLIDGIKERAQINQSNHLFVIVGRETFSSAMLNSLEFKNETNSIFVGEATGGKPNHYGDVRFFTLPNSNMIVTYSTKYFHHRDPAPSLYPNINIELSFGNYINCEDPVLEAIIGL